MHVSESWLQADMHQPIEPFIDSMFPISAIYGSSHVQR